METTIISLLSEVKENESLTKTMNSQTRIIDEIGLDSLEMINLILRIEEEFNIEIDFENFDICVMNTIGSLSEFIKSTKALS